MATITPQPATDEQKRRDARDRLREFADRLAARGAVLTTGEFERAVDDIRLIVQHSDVLESPTPYPLVVKVADDQVHAVAEVLSLVAQHVPYGILVIPESAAVIDVRPAGEES